MYSTFPPGPVSQKAAGEEGREGDAERDVIIWLYISLHCELAFSRPLPTRISANAWLSSRRSSSVGRGPASASRLDTALKLGKEPDASAGVQLGDR